MPPESAGSTGTRPLRPLTLYGHPVLMAPAAPVEVFDAELGQLVEDMFATMYAAPGVGLAATQVGVSLRLFTFDCGPGRKGHVCNPVLETVRGELREADEGCLSVPGLYVATVRSMEARVTGLDADGHPVEYEGREVLAQCLQHEYDHLDGMLYLDRLGGRTKRKAIQAVREAPWFGEQLRELSPTAPGMRWERSDDGRWTSVSTPGEVTE